MAVKADVMVRLDRSRRFDQQQGKVHNRWHPDIPAIVEVEPGQVVGIETLDAMGGEVKPGMTAAEASKVPGSLVHPLTGPVHVKGAEAGDLLDIRILEIVPEKTGFTEFSPGFGYLVSDFGSEAFVVHWDMRDGYATSRQMPGIRIPACLHMGVMGVAPSRELMEQIKAREQSWAEGGATACLPETKSAAPTGRIAEEGIRTISPHEVGGNLDIKQLVAGATLRLPVYVKGALFSTADAHFAQGDGESCGTAIEMGATVYVSFQVHKGAARDRGIRDVQFFRETEGSAIAGPKRFFATTGQSHGEGRSSKAMDLNAATRNALLNMIDYLVKERGLTRQQAYILCSVAVDLKISQIVDVPNYLVSAVLPLDVFV